MELLQRHRRPHLSSILRHWHPLQQQHRRHNLWPLHSLRQMLAAHCRPVPQRRTQRRISCRHRWQRKRAGLQQAPLQAQQPRQLLQRRRPQQGHRRRRQAALQQM